PPASELIGVWAFSEPFLLVSAFTCCSPRCSQRHKRKRPGALPSLEKCAGPLGNFGHGVRCKGRVSSLHWPVSRQLHRPTWGRDCTPCLFCPPFLSAIIASRLFYEEK